jgi:ribosomal protein S18 acetylase RimI-like enzyme
MNIIIKEINANSVKAVNTCDGEFIIDSRLALYVESDEIRYQIVKSPQTAKRYRADDVDYSAYVDDPAKTVFFAKVDGRIAGQIILRKNWNNYAFVEDMVVDREFRRQGIGEKLILQAEQWARARNLAGIMLETQNNNVRACQFYEKCGFRLGGFDKYLYKGINQKTDEIALYWYLCFEDTPPNPTLS